MKRDNIWEGFKKLFPDQVDQVETYQKIGSKTIKLKIKGYDDPPKFIIFLYNDPWDWTLGTKVWRARPRKKERLDFSELEKNWKTKVEEEDNNGNTSDNQ